MRVDTGVYEGGEISMYYDPMIAKLVSFGADREHAIEHMQKALDEFHIRGVSHNISFLAALMDHPRFHSGKMTTNFIAEEYPDGFHPADVPHDDPKLLVAVASCMHRAYQDRASQISGQVEGYERKVGDDWIAYVDGQRFEVIARPIAQGFHVEVDTEPYEVLTEWQLGTPLFRAKINTRPVCVQVERHDSAYRMFHAGSQADAVVLSPKIAALQELMPHKEPPDMSKYLLSPMPGLLLSVAVEEGAEVKEGEELAVVEAMKMENVLRAERDGTVKKVPTAPGDSLAVDQIIMEFE